MEIQEIKREEKKINSENSLSVANHVVKSNAMIESIYQLGPLEQKLILSLCSKIASNDNVFNSFEMSVSEFANFMGIENKNFELNRTLKKKCEDLVSKKITINKGTAKHPNWYMFNWFHHIEYKSGEGVISLQLHDDLIPYLLNLQSKYTKYRLGYVMNFKYEYSFRIYELMKEYERIGERTLLISDLKNMLSINSDKKYQKYSHFKANVIMKSLQEINRYSDITVTMVKEEKEGKKVAGIVFEIRPHNLKYPIDMLEEENEILSKTKEEIQKLLHHIILADFKAEFPPSKTDLFVKEAIAQLYLEIKRGEYSDKGVKFAQPYFTEVLIRKHAQMTGEEITKVQITRHETSLAVEKFNDMLLEAQEEETENISEE